MNARSWYPSSGKRFRLMGFLVLAGLIVLAGCDQGVGKLVPVEGKVTVDGKSMTGGEVRFWPETSKAGGPRIEPSAQIQTDGSYKLTTNGKPGAPAGKYKVTVMMPTAAGPGDSGGGLTSGPVGPPKEAPRIFNAKFESQIDTTLTVEVVPSGGQYDLKLTR